MKTDNIFVIIIVNSIEPYCYELNNIMALPIGFKYRFRYQRNKNGEWMPEIKDPKLLLKCDGLVVLREFQNSASFIPIRHINIYNVLVIGDIVYIEYTLKSRIQFSSNISKRDSQLTTFNNRIITDIKTHLYPNIPGSDLKNLVFFGTDYTYDFTDDDYCGSTEDEDSNRWGNLVELIGTYRNEGITTLKDVDFIKIIDIIDDNNIQASIVSDKSGNYFHLKNKCIYQIRFLQRTYTGRKGTSAVITPRTIELNVGSTELRTIISKIDVLGKYDLLNLSFRTEIAVNKMNTFITLHIKRINNDFSLPLIIVPVQITLSSWEIIISFMSILIFFGSLITYWCSGSIINYFSKPNTISAENIQILRNILLPIMILSGGGLLRNIRDFSLGRINV